MDHRGATRKAEDEKNITRRLAHNLSSLFGIVGRKPAADLASITVVGADLTRTDAYATAALVMGPRARAWLEGLNGYEAFAVLPDGRGWWTSGYPSVGSVPAV